MKLTNEKKGRGYEGRSMSVNARRAYDRGEMPKSKWSKKAMLNYIAEEICEEHAEILKELKKEDLAELVLVPTCGHHTGAFYRWTGFYEIDYWFLIAATEEELKSVMNNDCTKKELQEKKRLEEEHREHMKALAEKKEYWRTYYNPETTLSFEEWFEILDSNCKLGGEENEDFVKRIFG